MQEEGLEGVEVPGLGLEHGHAGAGGSVVSVAEMLRFEVGDLREIEGERAQGGGKSVLVAPTWTTLSNETIEILRAVVIVVGAKAKSLEELISFE